MRAREERDERRRAHHKRNSNANKQSPNAAKRQRKWNTALNAKVTTQVAAAVALYDKEQTANAQLASVIQGLTKDKAVVSAANPKSENDDVDTVAAIRKTKVASIISRVSKKKVQFNN